MATPVLDTAPTTETQKIITADDLLAMSSKGRYELTEGRLIEMSPPGSEHGLIVNTINYFVTDFVRHKKLGKVFAAETG